jgi:hypothetical protein
LIALVAVLTQPLTVGATAACFSFLVAGLSTGVLLALFLFAPRR